MMRQHQVLHLAFVFPDLGHFHPALQPIRQTLKENKTDFDNISAAALETEVLVFPIRLTVHTKSV